MSHRSLMCRYLILFSILGFDHAYAQEAYFNGTYFSSSGTEIGYIAKFDLLACAIQYIYIDSTSTIGHWDELALCPNGKLYAHNAAVDPSISGLYEIDLDNNSYTFLQSIPLSYSIQGIVCSCDTVIYGGGSRMFSYAVNTNVFQDLGTLPSSFFIFGDLLFANGELYAAAAPDKIININLDNLSNSYLIYEPTEWQIMGF